MGKARSTKSRELSRTVQKSFGEQLRAARKRARPKVSQFELAEALEVTRTSISNIENGRHRVFLDQVYAAAARLKIPAADLLPDESDIVVSLSVMVPPGARFGETSIEELLPIVEQAMRDTAAVVKPAGASARRNT